jgi:septal ring factor EnvC (AmiA/AmiB activator)
MKKILAILLLLSPALLHAAGAEEGDPVVAKLREALRNTMLQMRDVQGQLANAQAAQIASDAKVKELTAQNDKLTRQMIEDKNASTNSIAELNTRLEEQGVVIQKLNATVDQWKRGYNEATALAQKKEAERAKAAAQIIKLDRIVADQQIKNVQMYKVGTEILDRYEKFGLGEAILAREPFVGMTRAKFQTLMQDYQDKLVDQRISSTSSTTTSSSHERSNH